MREVGPRLRPDKTRIVYCREGRPRSEHEHTSFTVLGHAFRARRARGRNGRNFTGFLPAISPEALKAKGAELRRLRIHRRTDLWLDELARWLNPIVAGWINYYGRYYRSALDPLLKRVNAYLRRWAGRKHKRPRTDKRFRGGGGPGCSQDSQAYSPTGAWSARTKADRKSPVTGDCHAGICGSRGLRSPRPPDSTTVRSLAGRAAGCRNGD
jgi:hypothetical protein